MADLQDVLDLRGDNLQRLIAHQPRDGQRHLRHHFAVAHGDITLHIVLCVLNVLDLALVLTALYWWSKALEILGAGIT